MLGMLGAGSYFIYSPKAQPQVSDREGRQSSRVWGQAAEGMGRRNRQEELGEMSG